MPELVQAAITPYKKRPTHVRFSPLPASAILTQRCDADCGWIFAQHFCNRLGQAYLALKNILDESNPTHASVLDDIKRRFREETFTRESIAQVIHAHAELVRISASSPSELFF